MSPFPQPASPADLDDPYSTLRVATEDISGSVLVAHRLPRGVELVSRPACRAWRPLPDLPQAARVTRQPATTCLLCELLRDDTDLHAEVWRAYGAYGMRARDPLDARASYEGSEHWRDREAVGHARVTSAEISRHFAYHPYDQPLPRPGARETEKDLVSGKLLDARSKKARRAAQAVRAVYRVGMLTHGQLGRLLLEPELAAATRKGALSRELAALRFGQLLYGWTADWITPSGAERETVYVPGTYALPWLERNEPSGSAVGREVAYTKREDKLRFRAQVDHRLRAAEVFVQLRAGLYSGDAGGEWRAVGVAGREQTLSLPLDYWFGERQLKMAWHDGYRDRQTTPDGFAALAITPGGGRDGYLLPLFLEWDSGRKDLRESAEQMATYAALHRTGTVARRFPQLARAAGVRIPLVVVTGKPKRALDLLAETRAVCNERGVAPDQMPLMAVTDWATLTSGDPWRPGVFKTLHRIAGPMPGLADLLLHATRPLIETAPILLAAGVEIDLMGARVPGANGLGGGSRHRR